jgi:alkanesulfonate monooxygenase SsuD/methylene tetrahydromethanopterin reductase-like flavin-dependent oxidoreductase (luciferase family)
VVSAWAFHYRIRFQTRVDHAYIRGFVCHAEALGFDDGWSTEGILNPNFVLEPVTYIAHLAALTEKIRFSISLIILNHRNQIQLAKQLASVDHLTPSRSRRRCY